MTFREKLKKDTGLDVNGAGCPCDHGYEERQGFTVHCTSMTCAECWNREMKEKENKTMKYHVGDTVLVQGKVTQLDIRDYSLRLEFEDEVSAWFGEHEIFELPKPEKTYEQGLEDAWELARKIITTDLAALQKVFGTSDECQIIMTIEPQEALAKLKAYEEESEIKVGDVVSNGTHVLLCVKEDYGYFYFLDKDGSHIFLTKENLKKSKFTKTGKHIDIESLLEQIKGDANE